MLLYQIVGPSRAEPSLACGTLRHLAVHYGTSHHDSKHVSNVHIHIYIYIYIHTHTYIHTYNDHDNTIGVCEQTFLLCNPCNPAADTALQPLIWCFEGSFSQTSSSPEELFVHRHWLTNDDDNALYVLCPYASSSPDELHVFYVSPEDYTNSSPEEDI